MLRPGGISWNLPGLVDDCYFEQPSPEWGELGVTTDNPYYHVDDQDSAGPEVITIEQPALTTTEVGYLIGVHHFVPMDSAPVFPTVTVYSNGEVIGLVGEKGIALQGREFWIAAELFWTETGPILFTSEVPADHPWISESVGTVDDLQPGRSTFRRELPAPCALRGIVFCSSASSKLRIGRRSERLTGMR